MNGAGKTLAEGIEQMHQLTLLQEAHCDSGQGFLFARPLSVGDADAFLRNWRASDLSDPAPGPQPGTPHRKLPRTRGELPGAGAHSQRLLAAGGESA